MRPYESDPAVDSIGTFSLARLLRAVCAVLGIIAIVIGLVYAVRVFGWVHTALLNPSGFQERLVLWSAAVGGEKLDVVTGDTVYHAANFMAILVLGGGTVILAWIAMGLIVGGGKIVAWTVSERDAIRRILVQALGAAAARGQKPSAGGDVK